MKIIIKKIGQNNKQISAFIIWGAMMVGFRFGLQTNTCEFYSQNICLFVKKFAVYPFS